MLVATGEVLAVTPAARLSVAVAGGHGPDTYLTWAIRPSGAGSVVRLTVDEVGDARAAELEDDWLPALADLHAVLAPAAGAGTAAEPDVSRRAAP